MPWDKFKQSNGDKSEWCVYKVDSAGKKTGDSLSCHDSEKDAQAAVAALYASTNEMVTISFFLGESHLTDLKEALGDYSPTEAGLNVTLIEINESAAVSDYIDDLRQIVSWMSEDSQALTCEVTGVARYIGEEEDALVVTLDSQAIRSMRWWAELELDWMDIPHKETSTFSPQIRIARLAKDAVTPSIIPSVKEFRFTEISLSFGAEHRFDYTFHQERVVRDIAEMEQRAKDFKQARADAALVAAEKAKREMEDPPLKVRVIEQADSAGLRELDDRGRVKVQIVSEFTMNALNYPDIALPDDIDRSKLTDERFVTLPIGQYESESLNQRTYSKQSMDQLAQQVNERRPESNWGHLTDYQFGYVYNPPPVRWLAAQVDEQGIVWAKARALTPEARNYYEQADKDNARVGTSIFAWAEMDGETVINLDIITIDLADPARVGVPITSARPKVTSEQHQQHQDPNKQKDETTMGKTIEELTAELAQVSESVKTTEAAQLAAENRSKELSGVLAKLAEAFGLPADADLTAEAVRIKAEVAELRTENGKLLVEAIEAAALKASEFPVVQEGVKYLVNQKPPTKKDDIAAAVAAALEVPMIKQSIEREIAIAAGPNIRRAPNDPNAKPSDDKKHPAIHIPDESEWKKGVAS